MNYEGEIGSEVAEFEGETGELEQEGMESGGEFEGEGEGEGEAHEQFLGGILGSILGGEVAGPLSEAQEIELASELLEISNEQELEQFLGGLFKKVSRGVGSFIKSPIGRALGGVLKNVAKKALPVVGGALGSMVAPGIGTAIGSKLGSMAGGLFEMELESMPQEQAEYEVARRYVALASAAARNAALARPRGGVNPVTVARAAVARAARAYAPGVYKQMMRSLATRGVGTSRPGFARPPYARPYRRPGVPTATWPRPGPRPYQYRPTYGGAGVSYAPTDGAAPAPVPSMGIPDDAFEPVAPQPGAASWPAHAAQFGGMPMSGRWVRRGRKIIILGV